VGESERSVRKVFERAKLSRPCIIFFDELDALCPRRDDDGGGGNSVTKRVVNQLLTEMDGLEERKGIFIIAATNRPDIIDPAMLRPQRLDKLLYVPLPDQNAREQILVTLTRKTSLDKSVSLAVLAKKCVRFSGADMSALVREASLSALSRFMTSAHDIMAQQEGSNAMCSTHEQFLDKTNQFLSSKMEVKEESDMKITIVVTEMDFANALKKVLPSVSEQDEKNYLELKANLRAANSSS
jgi:SpoVK/Ycf46/Vps4 family AAA+-type ATPase